MKTSQWWELWRWMEVLAVAQLLIDADPPASRLLALTLAEHLRGGGHYSGI